MASPKRISVVGPRGEVLFSGESVIAKEPVDEPCPETKRSAESGLFPAVAHAGRPRRAPPPVTEATVAIDGEANTQRDLRDLVSGEQRERGPRAA